MSKFERFTLIFTVTSFVLVFLLGSQGLILKPLFTINVEDEYNTTNITIENIGMSQGKNSIIHVISKNSLNMTSNFCVESSGIKSDEKQIIVLFDQFSTGIACQLTFEGNIKFDLDHVTVSADDTSGLEWNPLDDFMTRLFWIQFGLYGTLGTASLALITLTLSFSRKKQTKTKVKEYTIKEENVLKEIRSAEDELNSLQKSLTTTSDSTLINSLNRRITFLDDRIRILNLELEQAKSSISLEGRFEAKVGEFFINWADLEQQVFRIAEKEKMDTVRMNFSYIIRELQKKGVFAGAVIEDLHSVRKFRNGLTHGFIKPEEKELDSQIMKVKTLLDTIKNDKLES